MNILVEDMSEMSTPCFGRKCRFADDDEDDDDEDDEDEDDDGGLSDVLWSCYLYPSARGPWVDPKFLNG